MLQGKNVISAKKHWHIAPTVALRTAHCCSWHKQTESTHPQQWRRPRAAGSVPCSSTRSRCRPPSGCATAAESCRSTESPPRCPSSVCHSSAWSAFGGRRSGFGETSPASCSWVPASPRPAGTGRWDWRLKQIPKHSAPRTLTTSRMNGVWNLIWRECAAFECCPFLRSWSKHDAHKDFQQVLISAYVQADCSASAWANFGGNQILWEVEQKCEEVSAQVKRRVEATWGRRGTEQMQLTHQREARRTGHLEKHVSQSVEAFVATDSICGTTAQRMAFKEAHGQRQSLFAARKSSFPQKTLYGGANTQKEHACG